MAMRMRRCSSRRAAIRVPATSCSELFTADTGPMQPRRGPCPPAARAAGPARVRRSSQQARQVFPDRGQELPLGGSKEEVPSREHAEREARTRLLAPEREIRARHLVVYDPPEYRDGTAE